MSTRLLDLIEKRCREAAVELVQVEADSGRPALVVTYSGALAAIGSDYELLTDPKAHSAVAENDRIVFASKKPSAGVCEEILARTGGDDALWFADCSHRDDPVFHLQLLEPAGGPPRATPDRGEGPGNLKQREKWFRESFGDAD